MNKEIKNYFENDRSYLGGMQLLSKYCRNIAYLNVLNQKGESPETLDKVYYELGKIGEIPETEWRKIISEEIITIPESAEERVSMIPEEIKQSVKLREEFPFLKSKDCPEAFHRLVGLMLTAYDSYRENHEKLFNATSDEEISELSKITVEDFIEDRLILDELNHYKNTGEILGKHPIFSVISVEKEFEALTSEALAKAIGNLRSNISRKNTSIELEMKEESPNSEKIEKWSKQSGEMKMKLEIAIKVQKDRG